MTSIRLTQYSRHAGSDCKVASDVLDSILANAGPGAINNRLVVGNQDHEDAAVYDLGNGQGLISTTDFFMPMVDDPFDFGRVAATNAMSDVFAMGGKPFMALGILGWPVDVLPARAAGDVVAGAQAVCRELGVALAGGHSIDTSEPMFGLAVSGMVPLEHMKRNIGARPGDKLYLTKPIGVGLLNEAGRKGKLDPEHHGFATETMLRPNVIGAALSRIKGVNAMTDVSGFGLAGHLYEMCHGSGVHARIEFSRIGRLRVAEGYRRQGLVPESTARNFKALGSALHPMDDAHWQWLCDPQTSGGLLIAVDPAWDDDVERAGREFGLTLTPFGECTAARDNEPVLRVMG
ncbi:selenide, water dikinase SelD [Larsenimonas rhizosphaerae]|uniref:Selenide, water dikinase n=1 Tax=Larsenimonas rhizosphaerae TaxID=2944682 RepID=A0AA42CYH5_9GAMM|nr:selenide, water dikinase SelD [Larsenimonas rhizosphaerae]MCM2131417.1 selenide, water dikinase SelD [Larsenimonas rhizosphaerae]MCX2525218.1 selenide, water dikinase SelD [Larsenimonas rhizosphaerae]